MDEKALKEEIKEANAEQKEARAEAEEVAVQEGAVAQDSQQHKEDVALAEEQLKQEQESEKEHEEWLAAEAERNRELSSEEEAKSFKRMLRMRRKDNRSHRFKPSDNDSRKSDAFELVIGGLALWIVQIFFFRMGTIPMPTSSWLTINLVFAAVAIFLCKLNEYEVGIVFLLQTGMPYYMPFIQAALSKIAFGTKSMVPASTIGLLTLPAIWPIWFLYSVRYHKGVWVRRFYKIYVFFLILLLVSLAVESGKNYRIPDPSVIKYEPWTIAKGLKEQASDFWNTIVGAKDSARKAWVNQLNYATGGLYESRVDKEEKEPLGVYLESIEPAMSGFMENEKALVFAKVRARTPDINEKVNVWVSCYAQTQDGEIAGEIKPKKHARLGKDESLNFQCWFDSGALPIGDNSVFVDVNFSFTTRSSLKRYFLEGTILDEKFDRSEENVWATPPYNSIMDKHPITKVSNAPVRVTMSATDSDIIGIYRTETEENFWQPRFTILISKVWDGELKEISSMKLSLPPGLKIDKCFPKFSGAGSEDGRNIYALDSPITEDLDVNQPINCIIDVADPISLIGPSSAEDTPPLSLGWFRLVTNYTYEISGMTTLKLMEQIDNDNTANTPALTTSSTDTTGGTQ